MNAETRINLAALKRQDPYISTITDSSTHVAVYSFSPQSNGWEKTDVEGTLFVYRRVAPPYWGFTIMNRLSMENLTEPLNDELEFQTQNPFLLYRNAKLLIYGIWFYDHDDCKRIGSLLEKLSKDTSNPVAANDINIQKINPFDIMPKSSSPTSNSVTSISPGSSVGGVQRPPSNNEEADSESEEKEVVQSSNKGVDIMDLLFKAQDKYEKEKRNTPDPSVESTANEALLSPVDTDVPLIKPVPVKQTHPQKLDVASLFKQPSVKQHDATADRNNASSQSLIPTPQIPTPTMPTPYAGMGITQHAVNIPPPSANVNIPNHHARNRMVRSFSMNEMALRQHAGLSVEKYTNGGIMSVEEVEASLKKGSVDSRQQELNSKLDKLIDHINMTGGLPSSGTATQPLFGIKEGTPPYPSGKTPTGNSGSIVVNGNSLHTGDDVFSTPETAHPYANKLPNFTTQNQVRFPIAVLPTIKQRSVSTSGISAAPPPGHLAATQSLAFSNVPQQHMTVANALTSLPRNNLPRRNEQSASLHGNAVVQRSPVTPTDPNLLVSSVATAVSSVHLGNKNKQVHAQNAPAASSKTSSPAVPATLISPEDFELSASTPQKKLELKQRLLRETPPITPNSTVPKVAKPTPVPLTKDQLQHTLTSLLKDPSFLAVIHDAYLANFKQS